MMEYQYSIFQEVDADFNRNDDPTKASISDLIAYFNENLPKRAVHEKITKSKISMAVGWSILEGFQDENEDDIFISVTHYERPKGLLKEILTNVENSLVYDAAHQSGRE